VTASAWLLTGPTGAGRETALDALARAGVECVDNLPPALLGHVVALPRDRPVVVAIDGRQGEAVRHLAPPDGVHVLYLDADDASLVRRLADTTAAHPCAAAGNTVEAIAAERSLLGSLRSVAEVVLDTSDLPADELRHRAVAAVLPMGAPAEADEMTCTVSSFGFKYGPQVEADWVIDVRFLPNPFWVKELRPLTGLDPAVRHYVLTHAEPGPRREGDGTLFVERLTSTLAWVLERAQAHGRRRLHVAVGCTGGRHRSVAIAVELGRGLHGAGFETRVVHRDVERPDPR